MHAAVRIDRAHLERRLLPIRIGGWCRIFPAAYAASPTGCGPGDSRFARRSSGFGLLYAAEDFRTAFLETVVRDAFDDGRDQRRIDWAEIEQRVWTTLDMAGPEATLTTVDLRGAGAVSIGVPTDVVQARDHAPGRAFGEALFRDHSDIDAIVFSSRLTEGGVIAVRGGEPLTRLVATPAAGLASHPDLVGVLDAFGIVIVEPPREPPPT